MNLYQKIYLKRHTQKNPDMEIAVLFNKLKVLKWLYKVMKLVDKFSDHLLPRAVEWVVKFYFQF